MIQDYFTIAIKNLRKRRLRSWLTMLGIFISIATIFLLISLSLGLENAVKEQFRQLGTDKFFVQPKGQLGAPGTGGAVELTKEDANVIKKVRGIKQTAITIAANAEITFKDKSKYVMAAGLDEESMGLFLESSSLKLDEGSLLKEGDDKKIMLGSQYKYNNFLSHPVKTGDKVLVNGNEYVVKAIAASLGNPQDDRNIYFLEDEARKLFNIPSRVDAIFIQINKGEDINEVAERVKKKLLKFRGLDEENADFSVLTPDQLLESFGTILTILTSFLIGIAAISLVVGGIGIANTMYTSVLERTKEIGIMKSVGARNKDILLIFLIESGLLGLIGGIIGVVLGIIIGKIVEQIAVNQLNTTLLQVSTPLYLIVGCLVFSFLIGALSGTLPAFRAAKINPVDALRYE